MVDEQKIAQETMTTELTGVLEEIAQEPEKKESNKHTPITVVDETNLLVGERPYKLIVNHRDAFEAEKLGERYSDILNRYDYVVADWGYDQLRLKGFFRAENKRVPADQKITALEDYLYEFCNFGCAYFVLERIGGEKKAKSRPRNKKKRSVKNQAHVVEKKEPVNVSKAKKPVIKQRVAAVQKPKFEKVVNVENQKRHFTIRKKEE